MNTGKRLSKLKLSLPIILHVASAVVALHATHASEAASGEGPTAVGRALLREQPDFRYSILQLTEVRELEKSHKCRVIANAQVRGLGLDFSVEAGLTVEKLISREFGHAWLETKPQVRLIRKDVILQTNLDGGRANVVPGGPSVLEMEINAGDLIVLSLRS